MKLKTLSELALFGTKIPNASLQRPKAPAFIPMGDRAARANPPNPKNDVP
jgi:hypothetical protein